MDNKRNRIRKTCYDASTGSVALRGRDEEPGSKEQGTVADIVMESQSNGRKKSRDGITANETNNRCSSTSLCVEEHPKGSK